MRSACSSGLLGFLFLFIIGCGGGSSSAPVSNLPVTPVSVTVSPTSANLGTGGTQQFAATVTGSANTAVTWAVAGGASNGTISLTGLYTAPATVPNPAQVTVTATSSADPTKSASATVTILAGVFVQIAPTTATVQTGASQNFTATVTGTTNLGLTWTVAGGSANGGVQAEPGGVGFYAAPATVPNPPQVTVTATSQADTTKSASATVTIIPAPPAVTVNPSSASVEVFGTQQFTASVTNTTNTAVTWEVNGITGGSQASGYISSNGLYVAPGAVPTTSNGSGQSAPTTVTVTAVSQASSSATGTAVVTVTNSQAQNSTSYFGASGGNQKDSQTKTNFIYCCGGTLGSLVTRGGTQYILSNNHVLAREDLGTVTSGSVPGDNIIQPGLIDASCGQTAFTVVANLSQFYDLQTGTGTKIDAAIAQLVQNSAMDSQGRILYLGATTDSNNVPVSGAPNAGSGLAESASLVGRGVAKSGRSTGLTCASISSISTTLQVSYPSGCNSTGTFSETFTNQVIVDGGAFSAPGDSGSLIVTQDTADPVALLFAGSDTNTSGNPIQPVLSYFQSGGNALTFVGGGPHAVIGCSLPTAPAHAISAVPLSAVSSQALLSAGAVRSAHVPELMAYPEVQALGIGASQDQPGEPAIVFFVTRTAPRTGIPQQVDGIRTRIVEGDLFTQRGLLSAEQTAALEQAQTPISNVYAISDAEYERAKAVHSARVDEWMRKTGVQGLGIGSSADSPGEAVLMIFLVRGVAHEPIPTLIDGLRTRIRESSPFLAGVGNHHLDAGCKAQPPKRRDP
jgi:hypothetical protein